MIEQRRILLVIPTRDRPARLLTALSSILNTQDGLCDVLIVWDGPDQSPIWINRQHQEPSIHTGINSVQLDMAGTYQEWVMPRLGSYRLIGFGSDDFIFHTPHWDSTLLAHTDTHPLAVMYGDDGIAHHILCTHAWVTAELIRQIGWVSLPGLKHLYFDNVWMSIGRSLSVLHYFVDLNIEHRHCIINPELKDDSYRESNSLRRVREDGVLYDNFVMNQWPDLAYEKFGVLVKNEWGECDQIHPAVAV